MKTQDQAHLNEEQIIRAVIDEEDLAREDRQHISECRLCNDKINQFQAELQELGENASLSVPPLTKKITLPAEEGTAVSYGARWFPSFGAAFMAGLVLFFYFLGMESMSPQLTVMQSPEALLEDEYLMEEIYEMVENPFSDVLYEITGDNNGFDDEFLEYIVPSVQEDFQSKYVIQGGSKQC